MKVDLNQMPADYCSCGHPFFRPRTLIKKVPAILAGAKEDQYYPVEFLACEKCGRPHPELTKINMPDPKLMK